MVQVRGKWLGERIHRSNLNRIEESHDWGICVVSAEHNLDHHVARSTIAKTLKERGLGPVPERPTSWATFVRSHAHLIAATDFFTTEVWAARGLVTHYTLIVIDIATLRVEVAGTTTHPVSEWMEQIARNLTDYEDGFLSGKRFLIIDRDCIFSPGFKSILARVKAPDKRGRRPRAA